MSSITISELHPSGSALFQDSESFLDELTDQEMEIVGGLYIQIFAELTQILTKLRLNSVKSNYNTYANTVGKTYTNTVGKFSAR